jgi:hypothetical protein
MVRREALKTERRLNTVDIYAVYTNTSKNYLDDVETEDFTCFWSDEKEAAEAMADEYGTDVDVWTLLYAFEVAECRWRTEQELKRYAPRLTYKPVIA